jgi:hypothetical protein
MSNQVNRSHTTIKVYVLQHTCDSIIQRVNARSLAPSRPCISSIEALQSKNGKQVQQQSGEARLIWFY